ncbi:MAG: fumarate hydratase [Synergistaceae bacterium]|jgi:tartrate/fumarate subfamily iron-sulfur-dependent hydro-lyase alpha chain|nr:fumarate hydratase [Synergistaceae bacterium]
MLFGIEVIRIRVLLFFLAASISMLVVSGPADASIEARGAILMNIKSGSVLYVQSEDVRIPPASLAKIMTMHIAADRIGAGQASLGDTVKISARAARQPGARMGLAAGEEVPLDELLKGVAVASGNDAAVAVAEHLSGTVEKFVRDMNAKAAELGMKNTVYRNPNGLPAAAQVTTARDMLTLCRSYIENHPDALRYHNLLEITYRNKTTTNKNPLLRTHPLVDGLKTGWIRASRHNLATTARSGDIRLISIVLSAPTSTDLTDGSARLIDAGFRTVWSGGRIKVKEQLEAPPGTYADIGPGSPFNEESRNLPVELDDLLEIADSSAAADDASPGKSLDAAVSAETGTDGVRNIGAGGVTEAVARLCAESNYHLSDSAIELLLSPDDADKDASEETPNLLSVCANQRTTIVMVEVGQDVHVTDGGLDDAIREGVRMGSLNRDESMEWLGEEDFETDDPQYAVNYDIVPGDRLRIRVIPIGFEIDRRFDVRSSPNSLGSVRNFITQTVKKAMPGLCLPMTVGVGMGRTIEESSLMAKRAITRGINEYNYDENWARLESDLLWAINDAGEDLPGLGDFDAALAVNIETPRIRTNISNMAVVIYISCHATNDLEIVL